jgi:tetratricopeptide (TPR) repeat protein
LTASSFILKGIEAASRDSLTEAEQCFREAFLLAKQEGGVFNLGAANLIRLLYQQKHSQEIASLIPEIGIIELLRLPQICILMTAESAFIDGQISMSLILYEYLYKANPRDKTILIGYSQALFAMGQISNSTKILQDYLIHKGPDAEIMTNLAIVMLESGHIEKSETLYRQALDLAPNQFITHYNLGKFLQLHGSLSEAIAEFDACLRLVPKAVEAIMAKAESLKAIGKDKESLKLYTQTLEGSQLCRDQSIALAKVLIVASLEENDYEDCKHYLASLSTDARADFQIKSIIYDLPSSLQDEYGGGSHLYDPKYLVKTKIFIKESKFLLRITDYVIANESMIRNRPGKPTRGGSQTHEIMESQNKLMNELKELLKKELIVYANQLDESIKPPPNASYRISGWGVSLESGGRQIRHTHPEAIVSAVLYLSIPKDMNSKDDKPGSLCFSNWNGKHSKRSLYITAKEGNLVMFPSYMPHETVSFVSTQRRICIAVNLIHIKSK